MISVTRSGWRNDEAKVPSLDDQAAALRPLLDMDRRGGLLMGHSYGGPVIARTAMNYSELIAGLIFVATTGDPELSAPRWYNRLAAALPRFVLGASLKGANAEIMRLCPQLEAMVPRWQDLTMPVLIVQGEQRLAWCIRATPCSCSGCLSIPRCGSSTARAKGTSCCGRRPR